MLEALKRVYLFTTCVLSTGEENSDEFRTTPGIRQGASSSIDLFMDDLIPFLKEKCVDEPIINMMHCLLHADDTALLSTNRQLFITKCNFMLNFFKDNSLSLNFKKSSFMIINPKNEDTRYDIELENGSRLFRIDYQ